MVDGDTAELEALARLEAALDRIAQAPRPMPEPPAARPEAPDTAALAQRLDTLIAQLREGLAGDGPANDAVLGEAMVDDALVGEV